MSDRLLRARDLADQFGVSTETILRWHRSGRLPGGYRLATGVLRWREHDVARWLDGRREGVVSEARCRGTVPVTETSAPANEEATDAR